MGRSRKPESVLDYEQSVLEEVRAEALNEHDSVRKLRVVSFESHSNGTGRKKRRSREVQFLVDESAAGGQVTYQIKSGEIRSRKSRRGLAPDQLALEVLTDLPINERSPDNLLARLLSIRKHRSKK